MRYVAATLIACLLAVTSWFGPSLAQITSPQPVSTYTTLTGSVAAQVIGQNPTRHNIRICNTGSTNAVWIWPGTSLTAASDYLIAPIASSVISCYVPPAGYNSTLNNAGQQWNAQTLGTTGTVSVEEW